MIYFFFGLRLLTPVLCFTLIPHIPPPQKKNTHTHQDVLSLLVIIWKYVTRSEVEVLVRVRAVDVVRVRLALVEVLVVRVRLRVGLDPLGLLHYLAILVHVDRVLLPPLRELLEVDALPVDRPIPPISTIL